MNRKRYSVEQLVSAMRQYELGTQVSGIVRKLEIAE